MLEALTDDPEQPLSAMIEVADRCNEVCVHCYQVQGQKGELGTEDWKAILDDLADLGVLFLTVSGGEATLRRDLLELLAYARQKRFAVKLYTNGLSMSADLARALAELAIQEVQISLYSPRAEVHDWVTRVPRSWERAVAGARHLVREGIPVVLKTPLMSVNVDDIDAYIALAAAVGADYSFDPHLDPREDGDRDPQRLGVPRDKHLALLRNPAIAPAATRAPEERRERRVCGACRGAVHIEANGEMRPCTQLDVPVGHARTDGVGRAWRENDAARALRALTWNDLHGCRDCDLQPYCHRCFANARTEGGDALGPYEGACQRALLQYELVEGVAPAVLGDRRVGPYRQAAAGAFRPIADRLAARDHELRARLGWVRRPAQDATGPAVSPGDLVQIRRPGARRAADEQVPGRRDDDRRVDRGRSTGRALP
ncbi:MAG: radical SAM protein [Sandaracinaceae bacterium]